MSIRNGLKARHAPLLRFERTVRESDFELAQEQILTLERFDPSTGAAHRGGEDGRTRGRRHFFAGTLHGGGQGLQPDGLGLLQPLRVGPAPNVEEAGLRIPTHADHRFRSMPITDSSACRSVIPTHADHPWSERVAVLDNLP